MDVQIIFRNKHTTTYTVVKYEFHTFNFVEFQYADETIEFLNTQEIFSLKQLP